MLKVTDFVLCSRETCTNAMTADDAIWDDRMDLPYCSKDHMLVDQEEQLMKVMDFEDAIYEDDTEYFDNYLSDTDALTNGS